MKIYKIKHKETGLYYDSTGRLTKDGTAYTNKITLESVIVFFIDGNMVSESEFKVEEQICYTVGDKIKFSNEKKSYTIMACNERYLICIKPFNLKRTVLYTIVDLQENIRGTEDLIFCMGFETVQSCQEALERLISGESCISRRNRTELSIIE